MRNVLDYLKQIGSRERLITALRGCVLTPEEAEELLALSEKRWGRSAGCDDLARHIRSRARLPRWTTAAEELVETALGIKVPRDQAGVTCSLGVTPRATVSVVIPTCREAVFRAIESLLPQLRRGDQVALMLDTSYPETPTADELREELCRRYPDRRCAIEVFPCATNPAMALGPGNTQRNYVMDEGLATGDYLFWLGDDDIAADGALDAIREAAADHPGMPLIFRFVSWWGEVLPRAGVFEQGRISDHNMVFPNVPDKLGRFQNTYTGDYEFGLETLAFYGGVEAAIWLPAVIAVSRPEGLCVVPL